MFKRLIKTALSWITLLTVLVSVTACQPAEPVQDPEEVVTLEFWNGFNAHEVEALEQMIDKYWAPTHPNIKINVKGDTDPDTILAAISGGEEIDVVILWDPYNVNLWARQGALVDLTPYIEASNINPQEVFVPGSLEWITQEDGRYYGLPFVNFNWGFYWNKGLFRQAGLDPEKPPKTIQELEEYARQLTIVENGEIVQLGWAINQDPSNMVNLALAFGGRFYDENTGEITANDPKIIEALTWDTNLASEVGLEKVNAFMAGFAGSDEGNDPFVLGKVAMTIKGCWDVTFLQNAAPDLDYGVGFIPASDPAYEGSNNVETNPLLMPITSKHPDEAWEFLWFMASNPEVSREFSSLVSNLPQLQSLVNITTGNPKTDFFIMMSNQPNAQAWAPVPVSPIYAAEWLTAMEAIYSGAASPEEALAVVDNNTQAALDELEP
jgi:multiple sugar transport system substrate-binding protein